MVSGLNVAGDVVKGGAARSASIWAARSQNIVVAILELARLACGSG
jgi:hypothetical protein